MLKYLLWCVCCMYMFVCVVCVHAHVSVCVHVEVRGKCLVPFLVALHLVFEAGSLWSWSSSIWLGWLARELLLGSTSFHLPSAGVADRHYLPGFFMWMLRTWTQGLNACVAVTLPTKPFPQPREPKYFKVKHEHHNNTHLLDYIQLHFLLNISCPGAGKPRLEHKTLD